MDPVLNKQAEKLIWIAEPSLGKEEYDAVGRCVAENWISQGPRVAEFENAIAQTAGKTYGSACNSGTTALHLALHVCDVGPGDEVIIPNLTMIALANAVLLTGATPVFAESDNDVGNVSLKTVQDCITDRTKAVIIVQKYAEPVKDTVSISNLCKGKGIKFIEDCAESHFALLEGKPVGSFSDLAIFSFYSNKNITTGEGGMVVTDVLEDKERLDRVRMHAFTPGKHFCHTERAFGYRMTDMQAAIGLEQVKKAPEFMEKRRKYRDMYEEQMQDLDSVRVPEAVKNSGLWVMPLLANSEEARNNIRQHIADRGIDSRTYFQPIHRQEFLKDITDKEYPRSDELGNCGFYVPLYPKLEEEQVQYVIDAIKEF